MQKGQFDIKSENDEAVSPNDPKSPVPLQKSADESVLSLREVELVEDIEIDENDMKKSVNSHLPTNRKFEDMDIENKASNVHYRGGSLYKIASDDKQMKNRSNVNVLPREFVDNRA